MNRTIILLMLSLAILSPAFSQITKTKLPSEAGVGCIDVTKRLNAKVENGRMNVAQCCQGLRLVADVIQTTVDSESKKEITGWHVFNAEGKELRGDEGEVRRQQTAALKAREKMDITETVIVVRELSQDFNKVCFIVDRQEKAMK